MTFIAECPGEQRARALARHPSSPRFAVGQRSGRDAVNTSAVQSLEAGKREHSMSNDFSGVHLRVGRPTDDLTAVVRFYRDGLAFEVLCEFKDHDGFDGVMLGHRGAGYHLEFSRKHGHRAGRAPTADNLLVFYLPDAQAWRRAVARLENAGHRAVKSFNPYWDRNGKTFEDPDGYRVVLENSGWTP
jgi:catechol 2,3-dioxygenase-like lactoylglutathione lyase family enzyme